MGSARVLAGRYHRHGERPAPAGSAELSKDADFDTATAIDERASLGQRDRSLEVVRSDDRVAAQPGAGSDGPERADLHDRLPDVRDVRAHRLEPGGPGGPGGGGAGGVILRS